MALTLPQLVQTRQEYLRQLRDTLGDMPAKFSKAELDAATTAADAWLTTNSASYNSALPTSFKNGATPAEKALLLALVALRRYGT